MDFYNVGSEQTKPPPPCRLLTLTDTTSQEIYENTYYYTTNNYPIAIRYWMTDLELGYSNEYMFHFTYDRLGRLVSRTSDYVYGGDLEYYAYEGDSLLPVRDSVQSLYSSHVEDLEYDGSGRLVKITRRDFQFVIPEDNPGPHPDEIYRFYYDVRGNRQEHPSNRGYPGLIQYSDNPSHYSLHPIWQIVYKNHSRNSVAGTLVNEDGLPANIGGMTARYECD
jgi:hypothetical protein